MCWFYFFLYVSEHRIPQITKAVLFSLVSIAAGKQASFGAFSWIFIAILTIVNGQTTQQEWTGLYFFFITHPVWALRLWLDDRSVHCEHVSRGLCLLIVNDWMVQYESELNRRFLKRQSVCPAVVTSYSNGGCDSILSANRLKRSTN